jgi:hypothetical protein
MIDVKPRATDVMRMHAEIYFSATLEDLNALCPLIYGHQKTASAQASRACALRHSA